MRQSKRIAAQMKKRAPQFKVGGSRLLDDSIPAKTWKRLYEEQRKKEELQAQIINRQAAKIFALANHLASEQQSARYWEAICKRSGIGGNLLDSRLTRRECVRCSAQIRGHDEEITSDP